MNKYMGFYELKRAGIPSVPWCLFDEKVSFDKNLLWTLRVAVENNNDLNLPRFVGVDSDEAYKAGMNLYNKYKNNGMVIYYPYFLAQKSGVVDISLNSIIIEAVEKDLWNLVTNGLKNVTIKIHNANKEFVGDEKFLTENETEEILKYANMVKSKYRDLIFEGKSVLLEWSFAYKSDINKKVLGERYLIFYELRCI